MKQLLVLLFSATALFAQVPAAYPGSYQVQNDTSTGTTFQKLAKLSAGKAILSGTADTSSIGICVQNCGTTGSAIIAFSGITGCVVDGTTTLDHWVVLSTTVTGDCHDTGATTYPTTGVVVGQVVQVSTGAASVSQINLTANTMAQASSGGGSSAFLDYSGVTTSVTNNGSDQTLYSTSIPGGTIGAGKCLRVEAAFKQDSSTATDYKFFYGTTSFTLRSALTTADLTNFPLIRFCNKAGVTNAQVLFPGNFFYQTSNVYASPATNLSDTSTFTEDSTSTLTLAIKTNAASDTVTRVHWHVEVDR